MAIVSSSAVARPPAATPWRLLALLVISIFINYIDRSNLSVAGPDLSRELAINPTRLGLLLSAFFWTYAAFQLVAGWLVDRYNVYWVYGLGFFVWSAATGLTGLAYGFGVLFLLRLLLGIGESVAYPAYSKIIASDFPERYRGTCNALIDAGSKIGPALGTLIGGLIVANYGWRTLFFLLGGGAMLWLVPWMWWIPRVPRGEARRAYAGPGFMEIIRKREVWGTFLGLFSINWAWYFLLTWLPSYLVMERHFSKTMMAVFGSLPFWGIAASALFGGWASDAWIARGGSPTLVRKTFTGVGLAMGTLMLPASLVTDNTVSMILLTLACLSFGLCTSNHWAVTQTLAGPVAAGKWTGMQNAFGNLAGVTAPFVTGLIVTRTGSFHLAFVAIALVLAMGVVAYVFVIRRIEPLAWASSGSTERPGE